MNFSSFHPSPLQLPPSPTRTSSGLRSRASPTIVPSSRPRLTRASFLGRPQKASAPESSEVEEQEVTDVEDLRTNQRQLDADVSRLASLIQDSNNVSRPSTSSRTQLEQHNTSLPEPSANPVPDEEPVSDEELEEMVKDGELIEDEQIQPPASWEYGMTPLKTPFRGGSIRPSRQSTPKSWSGSFRSSSSNGKYTSLMNTSSPRFDSDGESCKSHDPTFTK